MVKQGMDVAKVIKANIATLNSVGLQASFDGAALGKALSPALAEMKSLAITLPLDDSKETVDVVFDEQTGAIIGWHKTERSKERGLVTLKMAPGFAIPGKTQVRSFIVDKVVKGAVNAIAKEIDEAIKPAEVLQRFDAELKLPQLKAGEKKGHAGPAGTAAGAWHLQQDRIRVCGIAGILSGPGQDLRRRHHCL